jgi:hypothetical protein
MDAEGFIASYIAVLHRVQAATAIPLLPSTTLREFAILVRERLLSDAFSHLTTLAEIALYSPHPISQSQLEEASRLIDQLGLELTSAQQ